MSEFCPKQTFRSFFVNFFWIFKRRLKNIAISLMLSLFTHSSRLKNIWEHIAMFSNCSLNEYKFLMFNEHCQCSWMFLMFIFEEHGRTLTEHRKMFNQMFIMYLFGLKHHDESRGVTMRHDELLCVCDSISLIVTLGDFRSQRLWLMVTKNV